MTTNNIIVERGYDERYKWEYRSLLKVLNLQNIILIVISLIILIFSSIIAINKIKGASYIMGLSMIQILLLSRSLLNSIKIQGKEENKELIEDRIRGNTI